MPTTDVREVILVVDDEESVRRTVSDWLSSTNWSLEVLTAADHEQALLIANECPIDLAILDWNLGAGFNGLELLVDLQEWHPNIVAIMMTAFADQATPLDAMRRGVRDYLDKNQEFHRSNFLAAVERQLHFIRPAKLQRVLHNSLVAFRNSVEQILPLVQSLATFNDPVTLPEVIGSLFRFLLNATKASGGVLFVRHFDLQSMTEHTRVYDESGEPIEVDLVPYENSIAAAAISMGEPCAMAQLSTDPTSQLQLQEFERTKQSVLAAPLAVAPGVHVVLELFDKQTPDGELDQTGFGQVDVRLVRDAGEIGAEMLRQELSQRQTHQMLLDAVGAALHASTQVTDSMTTHAAPQATESAPSAVLDQLKVGLASTTSSPMTPEASIQLAEAIRVVALRHGEPAVQHCLRLVQSVCILLDESMGK
ncbi:MAG: response regulator [Gemmataceae bacterium]